MAEIKTGVTKSGIKEKCEWEGSGPCPRHQLHFSSGSPFKASAFGGSEDFVESLQSKGFNVDSDIMTAEGYEKYVETREESRVGRWSKNELIREGFLTEAEVDEVRNTPPKLKDASSNGSADEKPSFSLVNARVEKIVNDKEIAKLEKAARNPFNFKAKNELASAKSMDKLLTDNLNYFESTNNDKVRTVI